MIVGQSVTTYPLRNVTFDGELRDDQEAALAESVFRGNRANALNYSVVFARRSFLSTNRLTRLLSVPRAG
jgi:hypothetical protein